MEIKARIIRSLGITSGVSKTNGNPWQKGGIVIETLDSQYPKQIALSNMKSAEEFARLPIGSIANFKIDIESREYNGKFYTNVNCYQWELEGQQAPPQQQAYAQPQGGYAPSPQSSGYQQPPQGYAQGYQQPYAQPPQDDDNIPF